MTSIFLVTLTLNGREIDPIFAEASNEEHAGYKAVNFIKQTLGIQAKVAGVSLALRQKRQRYSFPQSIL
jgi:hypothetical protein